MAAAASAIAVYESLSSTTNPPGTLLYTIRDSTNALHAPCDVKLDAAGRMFIADTNSDRIVVLSGTTSAVPGAQLYSFHDAYQGFYRTRVALDAANQIYAVDDENARVLVLQAIPAAGTIGDPQFVGLRGQQYQVHGMDGAVYN